MCTLRHILIRWLILIPYFTIRIALVTTTAPLLYIPPSSPLSASTHSSSPLFILSILLIGQVGIERADLEDIWAKSDFITVHTPLTKETNNLIDDVTIAKCKHGVRIVNCARGASCRPFLFCLCREKSSIVYVATSHSSTLLHGYSHILPYIVKVKTKRQIRQIFFREIFSLERNFVSPEIFSPQRDHFGCVGTFSTHEIPHTAKMVPMGVKNLPEEKKSLWDRLQGQPPHFFPRFEKVSVHLSPSILFRLL